MAHPLRRPYKPVVDPFATILAPGAFLSLLKVGRVCVHVCVRAVGAHHE